MSLELQEQLNEVLAELKQSQEREAKLAAENRAILETISSITLAENKQQIFQELKKVLSLYINFSDFLVLAKQKTSQQFKTLLSSNPLFENLCWQKQSKFDRALSGECILLFEPTQLNQFSSLKVLSDKPIESMLITGASGAITDSIIVILGNRVGQFNLESRETLSRFRPLLERALIDIEQNEQLQKLVDVKTHQLKKAQVKAEKANEAKSRFLAMMSHELRTPLSAVLGYVDVLVADLKQEEQLKMLAKMESAAGLLLVLINDILELSRIESGEFRIDYQWVNLNAELDAMLEHFAIIAHKKGLKLDANFELDRSQLIWIDPARIMQIVFNLLGNAIKFTHTGQISLSFKISENSLDIDVVDTGIGIDPTRLNTIFTQFKQADDSITRNYGGSGLGLTISKHLVMLMNGKILVESQLGLGSKFHIQIPISIKKQSEDDTLELIESENDKSLLILVVEDTKTNQMVLKLLLEKMNHQVIIANNGKESVDYLRENIAGVDVIFMDISMPVMDGLTATKEIRKFCKKTPIIALTAHAMEQDKQTCLNSGMNAFVAKPIRSKEIQRSLQAVIR